MSDAERIAYIIGWLHGFEPTLWTFVGESLADETVSEYSQLVHELPKLLSIKEVGE